MSKGLHDEGMSDDRCLQLAQSIRTILGELAERAAAALKKDKEIQTALSTLMAVHSNSDTEAKGTTASPEQTSRKSEIQTRAEE